MFGSVCSFTHEVPHALKLLLQLIPHDVPSHVADPFAGAGQDEHDDPHELIDPLLAHVPLQLCVPLGQRHWLLWHVVPPVQVWPQAPQLLLSLVKSAQVPLQTL